MNDNNQYMVQVGDYDNNTYIIQEGSGLPVQYDGGTIIGNELGDGSNLVAEPRWLQGSGRNNKVLSGNQSFLNGDLVSVSGTGLNLNTRFTPSSIVLNASAGAQFDQDNLRIASAVTGSGARGRPRGRKPSRGNFPVVPIDMVRQLGIEQQVILQPTVPVAMKNKSTMSKPICNSKKTQFCETDANMSTMGTNTEPLVKHIFKPVFIPIPVPVYVPVPVFIKEKSQKVKDSTPVASVIMEETNLAGSSFKTPIADPVESKEPEVNFSTDKDIIEMEQSNSPSNDQPKQVNNRKRKLDEEDSTTNKIQKIEIISTDKKETEYNLKYNYGINAWNHWSQNESLLTLTESELSLKLGDFVQNARKPHNEPYNPDSIVYLALGIQFYLIKHDRHFNIFTDSAFKVFQTELNKLLESFKPKLSEDQLLFCRIEEEHLWESQQLGIKTSGILVYSVCYLLTKQLKIKDYETLLQIKTDQIIVHSDRITYKEQEDSEPIVLCQLSDKFFDILNCYMEKRKLIDISSPTLILGPKESENNDLELDRNSIEDNELEFMYNRIKIIKEVQENLFL